MKYRIRESYLQNKVTGEKIPIWFVEQKGWFGWNRLDLGNCKWKWYENDESIFGADSFSYFSLKELAEECLENITPTSSNN